MSGKLSSDDYDSFLGVPHPMDVPSLPLPGLDSPKNVDDLLHFGTPKRRKYKAPPGVTSSSTASPSLTPSDSMSPIASPCRTPSDSMSPNASPRRMPSSWTPPKSVDVVNLQVSRQGQTNPVTVLLVLMGDTVSANKIAPLSRMKFKYMEKTMLPRRLEGDLIVPKYPFAYDNSWWMSATKVQDIEGNLETLHKWIKRGVYGDIIFNFRTLMITDDAAHDIEAHLDGKADRSDLFCTDEFI